MNAALQDHGLVIVNWGDDPIWLGRPCGDGQSRHKQIQHKENGQRALRYGVAIRGCREHHFLQ